MRIFDFIEQSNQAKSVDEVFGLFRETIGEFGFNRLAFAATTQPARDDLSRRGLDPVVTMNFSDQWVEHYFKNRYEDFDPILQLAPQVDSLIDWDDVVKNAPLTSKQMRLMLESRECGLHNGISIPVHGPRGEGYVVSLATEQRQREGPANLAALQIAAIQLQLAYSRLGQKSGEAIEPVHLTDRERECLTWTARGKSAWAISMIIGVSEHTVNFHLKSVMRKLKASNRIQAVALAVRLGLVNP